MRNEPTTFVQRRTLHMGGSSHDAVEGAGHALLPMGVGVGPRRYSCHLSDDIGADTDRSEHR